LRDGLAPSCTGAAQLDAHWGVKMVPKRYRQQIPAPRDRDGPGAAARPVHPYANPDATARQASATMAQLRGLATNLEFSGANQEAFTQGIVCLLKSSGPGVPEFVRGALHGRLGDAAGGLVWDLFLNGIHEPGADTANTSGQSLAGVCLAHGTLDVFREVVLSGAPARDGEPAWPSSRLHWLDLLCTTQSQRSHGAWDGLDESADRLVHLAATHGEFWPRHCAAALELAMEFDSNSLAIARFVDAPSAAGAFVRQFLMDRQLRALDSASTHPLDEGESTTPASNNLRRAKRAGL